MRDFRAHPEDKGEPPIVAGMRMEDSGVSAEVPMVTPEAGPAATKAATKAAASDVGVSPPAPAVDGAAGSPPLPEEKLEGKELLEALKKQVSFVL